MKENILFGTYTRNNSQGIYQTVLDSDTSQLSDPKLLISGIDNPTYLTTTSDNYLITVAVKHNQGGIAIYNLNDQNPVLVDENLTDGAAPCYVSFDQKRQLVFTANYHKGQVDVFKLNEQRHLTLCDTVQYSGNGPKDEQDGPHAHYADLTPDNKLVTIDLGSDQVHTYEVSNEGKLTEIQVFKTPEGFGPRHITFSKNGHLAFLAGELSSEVAVLTYKDGHFDLIQIISTIPEDWSSHNGVAAIRISDDNRFLYVSNRGNNSIAVFSIADDGILSLVQITPTNGDFPRDFAINYTGKYLIVAHQNSTVASLFEINSKTGKLTMLQTDIPIPEGVCVHFVK